MVNPIVVVPLDGTRQACLIVEVAVGVEYIVAIELISIAVECAGSRLGGYQDLAASAAAKSRIVGASLQSKLLNRIHARHVQQREIRTAVVDVRSVHRPVVGLSRERRSPRLMVRVVQAETDFVGQSADHAWLQGNQLLEVTIV